MNIDITQRPSLLLLNLVHSSMPSWITMASTVADGVPTPAQWSRSPAGSETFICLVRTYHPTMYVKRTAEADIWAGSPNLKHSHTW